MITVEWNATVPVDLLGVKLGELTPPVHPTQFVAWKGSVPIVVLEHNDEPVSVVMDDAGIHVTDHRLGTQRHVKADEYDRIEWKA